MQVSRSLPAPACRQGRGGGQQSWRETVQFDDENERPPWRLTSYAHERGEPSDLHGDTSFEELRWQQLQAARSGTPAAQVSSCVGHHWHGSPHVSLGGDSSSMNMQAFSPHSLTAVC